MLKRLAKRCALALPVVGPYVRETDRLRSSFCGTQPPGHYYSPIPAIDDVRAREAQIWQREKTRLLPGIELNELSQLELLDQLAAYHADQPFTERKGAGLRYFFENDFFSFSDAIVYHAMLRHLRPRRVIEIGSGFSSCVLLDTNERFFGGSIRCTFIEPNAERLYGLLKEEDRGRLDILERPLQDVDLQVFSELESGDILFVDSSHVSKTGSDVNLIFFEILPALKPGVLIHVHDVFYPFEYPREYVYQQWAWNEAYLLRAFLSFNREFRIALFPSFLERFHAEHLRRALPLAWKHPPAWPTLRGASFWMQRAVATAAT